MDRKPTMIAIEAYEDPLPRQSGNVPAFLMKLWKLVEDPDLNEIISWNENGETFKVHDQIGFSKDVLPKYYKHNNFSSFVRQVNMYGFRKIVDPTSGSLKPENNEWEFYHQHFQRGQPHLMSMIKRKATTKDHDNKAAANQVTQLFGEVERLKSEHENVSTKLENVKKENELLWREVGDLRDQHKNQQVVINKLIQVFVKILMTNKKDIPRGVKRRALDFPVIDTKVARTSTQEVLPYSGSAQLYNHILPAENVYAVESPSPIRLTELPEDNITVVDEGTTTNYEQVASSSDLPTNLDNTDSLVFEATDGTDNISSTKALPTTKKPFVIKSDQKTITILPSKSKKSQLQPSQINTTTSTTGGATTKSNTEAKQVSNSGFVFPEKYVERPVDTSQLNFALSQEDTNEADDSYINNALIVREPTNVLLTPETNGPPLIVANKLLSKDPEPMTTPVVSLPPHIGIKPAYARQDSFRDRKEISDNVERINRSIEVIQDMLENQPVNLDLKSLNYTENILPEDVSVQDLSRLLLSNPQPSTSTEDIENDGQLIPYVEPLSPSQYMDPQFTSNSDFFRNVLNDTNNKGDDDILVE